MTQPLLKGKHFFCREWVFAKIQHCLDNRPTSKTCGAIVMGGPGSGKTALCCEIVWPTSAHGRQRELSRRVIAYHFCQAHDTDTLSLPRFILCLVEQLSRSEALPSFSDRLLEPEVQQSLEAGEIEKNPDEAFKRAILFPLLEIDPPQQIFLLLVDSIDESYLQCSSERAAGSRTVAELLANHHQLFPQWLLLVCSARKQSKSVTKLFTGFRKICLDDLRKAHVVRDVQQYILSRLDHEEALRQHLSRETAEMLNQLHIKSNGCFLYLEKVLDGVGDSFIVLREIREIPGTLNGLYLWLCQRLFAKKQFLKVQPILNVLLASRRPISVDDVYLCVSAKHRSLSQDDFFKRLQMLRKVLTEGKDGYKILFHHSFAEWLLDVKHCTQKYLCNATDGHGMLALGYTIKGRELSGVEVQDFALHLSKMNLQKPLEPFHLPLWMIYSGAPLEQLVLSTAPRDQKVAKLLLESGAASSNCPRIVVQREATSSDTSEDVTSVTVVVPEGDIGIPVDPCEEDGYDYSPDPADTLSVDSKRRTLLHNAAYEGNITLTNVLLAKKINVELEDKNGQTALNLAARQGHAEVVRTLLRAGADADHTDHEGWTPLRSAAWGGHTEVVTALLEHGVSVDLPDSDRRTALRAAAWGGHEDIVCQLLKHGASANGIDNEGRTALIAAAYMGHGEIVEHLLSYGAELNHEDADGRTALSVAALCVPASEGHASVVSILLERGSKVDHKDKDGMTPLLVAAFEGHRDVCEMLLEYDADVDHADDIGRTPLFAAASMGHSDVLSLLLFFGAAVDAIDADGRTVLSVAAAQGNVDVARQLLDRGLDEMHRDNAGWTPLHYAAFEGHREVCDALLEAGARVNEVDNDGKHALILAASEGHLGATETLVEHGADIDHRSHDGKTSLRVAALEGHRDVVATLISQGGDVNYKDADHRSTLYILSLENKVSMASFVLDSGGDVDSTDLEGRTPLHVAAWQNHYEMVEMLLSGGARVDAVDRDNRTALQSAAWQGHARLVRLLLDRSANIDHTCNQGATALCIAAQEGHEEVVRVLLERNADPHHADHFGRSPIRVAVKCGHNNVVRLLDEYCGSSGSSRTSVSGQSGRPSVPGSGSTTSMASNSTAETKPCSAILCPPPAVSPECCVDKRRSFVSEPSSSKSSGNLTGGSTGGKSSQRSVQGGVLGPEGTPVGEGDSSGNGNENRQRLNVLSQQQYHHGQQQLSFTQQLQQCTRHRNRPTSRLLSPLSEPQSAANTPPQSPLGVAHLNSPVAPSSSPLGGYPNQKHLLSLAQRHVRALGQQDHRRGVPMTTVLTVEPPMVTSPSKMLGDLLGGKPKRNGIVTNPNFKVAAGGGGVGGGGESHGTHSVNGNQYHIQVAYKQQLKSLAETPRPRPRPNGLHLKKETPL